MGAPKGNKYALGNNGGRPPKFENIEDLENKIIEYFNTCIPNTDENGEPTPCDTPSVTGLALFLGFSNKSSLYDYRDKKVFSNSIKRALTCIEHHYEQGLNYKGSAGAIFALKNFGWKDRSEVTIDNTPMSEEERMARIAALKAKMLEE